MCNSCSDQTKLHQQVEPVVKLCECDLIIDTFRWLRFSDRIHWIPICLGAMLKISSASSSQGFSISSLPDKSIMLFLEWLIAITIRATTRQEQTHFQLSWLYKSSRWQKNECATPTFTWCRFVVFYVHIISLFCV